MKKLITLVLFACIQLSVLAQDNVENNIKSLIDKEEYEQVIKQYATNSSNYSAKTLFYIGFAYFMKEDDNNCLKFMNLSIGKNPKDPKVFSIKGATLNYMSQFEDAVKCFQAAISIDPSNEEYYSGLGDAYYNLGKKDMALETYKKATEQKDVSDRPFTMIPQIYAEQKKDDKALEAFYVARNKISPKSESYSNMLFNIGLFEYKKGNYEKAEAAFMELIQIAPEDYHVYAKLIQTYYARKQYEKAKPYKAILYNAYKKGVLKDNMKEMFCFDQFKCKEKPIQVYERFEEGSSSEIYNKHLFYIMDPNDKIEYRIQTEYSPFSDELGSKKYLLCMTRGGTHYTFNIGFNDDYDYDEMKQSVINILEEKVKPAASSTPTK